MDDRQTSRQDGADASLFSKINKNKASTTETAFELDEKMKKIDMKPPAIASPTIGLLAKNAALLPTGIVRVKQLKDSAPSASGSATGNPRNKTALAPGHSLMDWIRLGTSGIDLTGVGGQLLTVTPAELAKHNKENDAWIAIRGVVYNVSRYMNFHPGGVPELMKGVGKDATKLFDDVHAWVNYQSILQKCIVGRLERCVNVDLLMETDNSKSKKKLTESEKTKKPVPEPINVKMDWRQTTNTVSLFYTTTSADNPVGECQMKKLNDSEFALRIFLENTKDIVMHQVKLAEEVEWPPNWQRSCNTLEIEIVFKKKNRGIWQTYGTFLASRDKTDPTKRTYNEYEVLENTPLCKVVHLLVLRAQNYIQLVPPGRHVEAKMNVMGTEVSRPYTPVPGFLHPEDRPASDTDSSCLCLIVKRYEDGALSPRLVELKPGEQIKLSNILGEFKIEEYDDYEKMHMLAAGTGLTVMLSIIKRALSRRNTLNINLINFNRNEDNVFYKQQLDRVSKERTLTVTHVLSEAESSWTGKTGNVSKELLKDLIGEHSVKACIFTCGPRGFMKTANEFLQNLGWQSSQIYEFDA